MPMKNNENLEKYFISNGINYFPVGEIGTIECISPTVDNLKKTLCSEESIVYPPAKTAPKETKDRLATRGLCEERLVLETFDNGMLKKVYGLIPAISDVSVKNKSVVIVSFCDGTKEKAVLHKEDTFSLEQGIAICISKKLLSDETGGRGNAAYNKLVRYGVKKYNDCEKNRVKEKKSRAEAKKQKALREEKRKKKNEKKKEREINIRKEAYLRAMREMENNNNPERAS
jgi:hypothetical protein